MKRRAKGMLGGWWCTNGASFRSSRAQKTGLDFGKTSKSQNPYIYTVYTSPLFRTPAINYRHDVPKLRQGSCGASLKVSPAVHDGAWVEVSVRLKD